jgi:hypothetical protein
MESAERIVEDGQHLGQPCRWCNTPIAVGHALAVCTACRGLHHAPCWDRSLGCATQGCVNAPLATLPVQAAPAPVAPMMTAAAGPQAPPGLKMCNRCRQLMPQYEDLCPSCNAINTPDGMYHGPKSNAPGAVGSFVLSIVSLLICGIILGPVAYSQANKAKGQIERNPRYGGIGYVNAAKVISIIAIVLSVIGILLNLGKLANR